MKVCIHCQKNYDETWGVCLTCSRPLTIAEAPLKNSSDQDPRVKVFECVTTTGFIAVAVAFLLIWGIGFGHGMTSQGSERLSALFAEEAKILTLLLCLLPVMGVCFFLAGIFLKIGSFRIGRYLHFTGLYMALSYPLVLVMGSTRAYMNIYPGGLWFDAIPLQMMLIMTVFTALFAGLIWSAHKIIK